MRQILTTVSTVAPSIAGTNYGPISGPVVFGSGETAGTQPWPVAGTFSNLVIRLDVAPGAGKSWVFALRINGATTALSVTISDSALTARDTTHSVSIAPGDRVTLISTATGSPSTPGTNGVQSALEFTSTATGESGYGGRCTAILAGGAGTRYAPPLTGDVWAATAVDDLIPLAGTITALYLVAPTAPSSGRSATGTLYLNGVKQDGTGGTANTTVSLTAGMTSAVSTVALAVVPGDRVYLEGVKVGVGSEAVGYALRFVAAIDGLSIVAGGHSASLPTTATQHTTPGWGNSVWTASETTYAADGAVNPLAISALRVRLSAAPGTGKTYTLSLRVNGASPSGTPSVTISDVATAGADATGTVTIADTNTWVMRAVPSGTPASSVARWAMVQGTPALVTVPDVVGETEAAAGTLLTGAGLTAGTLTTASSPTVAIGLVISQSPTAGSLVAPGSAVNLVISTGPADAPPVYVIGIGETTVVPLLATFRIQETIDAPDTMIADVFSLAAGDAGPSLPAYQARVLADGASAYWPLDDPEGSTIARDLVGTEVSALSAPFLRFALGQPVVVTENGVRIFGGVVTGTREQGLTGPSATDLVVEIQATSYELSAARRVITAAISQDGAETIGAAFATLVTDYYAEVGVSLHPSQAAGPALPAATFTRVRGDGVNKHLASSVGYLQSIDFENRLRAWAPGDILAPANYDEAVNPELLTGDITVERQLQNGYANRIILTGDPIPVPNHVDHYTGDGTTDTWPVTYKVDGPYPYFVDGAVAQGVIQYPATSTTEAIGGVEAPVGFQWEYDPIALTIRRRLGPVAAGTPFDFPYDGLFIPAGTAEDAGEIADYGLWEHVENVTAVITDISAQGYAEALLAAKIASKDEIVRLQTRALGFHPGQTMTIASFSRLLAGDYLITQVDTGSESGGILLVRSITASKSQNNTHDWRRVYQQWAGASAQTE